MIVRFEMICSHIWILVLSHLLLSLRLRTDIGRQRGGDCWEMVVLCLSQTTFLWPPWFHLPISPDSFVCMRTTEIFSPPSQHYIRFTGEGQTHVCSHQHSRGLLFHNKYWPLCKCIISKYIKLSNCQSWQVVGTISTTCVFTNTIYIYLKNMLL